MYCVTVAPNYWTTDAAGLARLQSVARTQGTFEYTAAFAEDLPALQDAARSCPTAIIKIEWSAP